MAQIGHCYGSEYHLMRFLGHHRDLLDERIMKGLQEYGKIHWLDFEFDDPLSVLSGDKELKGLSFLYKLDLPVERIDAAISEYHNYNINKIDNWQDWDAIFTLNGTLYLVEAKAHTIELSSGDEKHGGQSKEEILRFFREQLEDNPEYLLPVSEAWLGKYYQLANRLATAALLNKHGIKTKVLYIYFTNGFDKRIIESRKIVRIYEDNASQKDYEKAIIREKRALSISERESNVSKLLSAPIFIKADSKDYDD